MYFKKKAPGVVMCILGTGFFSLAISGLSIKGNKKIVISTVSRIQCGPLL